MITRSKTNYSSTKPDSKGHILALTGLRAIAAYFVFLHHLPIKSLVIPGWDIQREMHIGVTIFYVLSGFLITLRYYDSVELSGKWLKRYFLNRFARIYPVYFLLLIPTMILLKEGNIVHWILNITLSHGFFEQVSMHSGIHQAWSLTVEECFYASAPIIFMAIRRHGNLIRPILVMISLLLCAIWVGQLVDFYGFMGSPKFVLLYTYFGRFMEFFLGIQLALWMRRSEGDRSILDQIPQPTWIGVAGILGCLVLLSQLYTPELKFGLYHPIGIFTNNLILPCFVVLVIYGLSINESWLQSFLSHRIMVLLGKASYVFYLIHMGVYSGWLEYKGIDHPLLLFIALNLISILIYLGYEHPLNKRIRRLIP